MGISDILLEDNPAMDWHPVQGGVAILLGMLHATKTGISSVSVGLWLVCHTKRNFSTLPFKSLNARIEGKFLADTVENLTGLV